MYFERGSHCPNPGCRGIIRLDKSSGKNVLSCDCHPAGHYALITQRQAADFERGEAIELDDFPAPIEDRWYFDLYQSHLQKID